MLKPLEALRRLQEHSCGWEGADGSLHVDERGFLGALRPFRGLEEENFHEVVECLFALEGSIREKDLAKELVVAVHELLSSARFLALDSTGLLRRNDLLSSDQVLAIERWLGVIERSWSKLLLGLGARCSIGPYADYVAEYGAGQIPGGLLSVLVDALRVEDEDIPVSAARAIARVGSVARRHSDEIRAIAASKPAEIQLEILKAVAAIQGE